MMHRQPIIISLIFLICLISPVNSEYAIVWGRGIDYAISIDGGTYYGTSIIAPDSNSTKTDLSITTLQGIHEWARWYSEPFDQDTVISNTVYVWISRTQIINDSGQFRWTLYDYNPTDGSSTLIVQSNWFDFPANTEIETTAVLTASYTIAASHRSKFVLEYNATSGGGQAVLVVDEGDPNYDAVWNCSNGQTYIATGVKETAAVVADLSLPVTIACSSDADCDDNNSLTTDTCINPGTVDSYCQNSPCTVVCSVDSDCDDGNILTTDTCVNPASCNAYCTNSATGGQCSSDSECDDSDPLTTDTCINPGTVDSYCQNSPCTTVCSVDSDCDDGDPATTDSCIAPGSCDSYCRNTNPCVVACSEDGHCDDGDPITIDKCNNPGTCDSYCSHVGCSPRCVTNADCDDGDPATLDVCAGAGRCSAVCANLLNCGNGECEEGETECNCPSDCGVCTGITYVKCREYACIGNACKNTIKLNCCGNGRCEINEDYSNCPEDCKPRRITIELINYNENENRIKGEKIILKTSVEADGVKVINAEVKAKSFFGEIELYNDGRHDDGTNLDNIYANYIILGEDISKGDYEIEIEAKFKGSKGILTKKFIVNPVLNLTLSTDKVQYNVGDLINISGNVARKTTGLKLPVDLNIVYNDEVLFEKTVDSDEAGNFSASYHSSFLDPSGGWIVSAFTVDENGNVGYSENAIIFSSPEFTEFLTLEFIKQPKQIYKRGEQFDVAVLVRRESGELVKGATVKTVTVGGEVVEFVEDENGFYNYSTTIGWDSELGSHKYEIIAIKIEEGATYGGNLFMDFNVEAVEYNITILEPVERRYMVGEEATFKVRLTYPNGEPVIRSSIDSVINGKPVEMVAVGDGVYVGFHIIDADDLGKISFSIDSTDPYNNTASTQLELEVAGTSFLYYLRKYSLSIALLILALFLALSITMLNLAKKRRLNSLKKREAELLEQLKDVQKQYFKEVIINRTSYDSLMEKYESELNSVRKSIEFMEKRRKEKGGKNV